MSVAYVGPAVGSVPSPLYAVGFATGGADEGGAPSILYTVDPANGVASEVAPIMLGTEQLHGITGIDFSPSGVLYAADNAGQQLITINKATGAATVVGPYGGSARFPDISFDAYGYLYGWDRNHDDLARIDLDGTTRWVGYFDYDTWGAGLAVDSSNHMYVKARDMIYGVSPQTGTALDTGTALVDSGANGVETNNPADFSPDNVLYTVLRPESLGYPGTGSTLETVDQVSGLVTTIGNDPNIMITGLAFDTTAAPLGPSADLKITMTDDVVRQTVGGEVTFTVSVHNRGPDSAADVTVSYPLPAGETFVSDDPAGAYDSTTGTWTVGTLSADHTATLHVTVDITQVGYLTNDATVSSNVYNPGPLTDGITLTTGVAPQVTLDPVDVSVLDGAIVSFTSTGSGVPGVTQRWERSTDGGTTWADLDAEGDLLTFNATTEMNGYQYHAVFANDFGTVTSATATLTINSNPAVTGLSAIVAKGKITIAWTGTTGTPAPSDYRYQLNGKGAWTGCISGTTVKAGGTKTVSVQAHSTLGWGVPVSVKVTK